MLLRNCGHGVRALERVRAACVLVLLTRSRKWHRGRTATAQRPNPAHCNGPATKPGCGAGSMFGIPLKAAAPSRATQGS